MKIPFVDLKLQYKTLENEIDAVIKRKLLEGNFIGGEDVEGFEREFASFCGVKYGVGVGSGTDALRFALMATGVKDGDEVITVPNTFIATTEAISQAGGKIIFVDIDPKTYNIDVSKLEDKITKRTKAIIPVHLYGQIADMDPIIEIAEKYNLFVIEDACQSHGAEYKGKRAGSIGTAGCFSFYPGKNLGACGEAGMVVTNDKEIADKIRMLNNHGQSKRYYHEVEGYNGRLDAIQAGILRIKLRKLALWNEMRRKNARRYNELLKGDDIILPAEPYWSKSVYHLYVVQIKDRDRVQRKLEENGISTGLHYPLPLHLQNAYKDRGYKRGDFPITEMVSEKILSLPIFPELKEEQVKYIVDKIKEIN